jgi:hypothetical protein
MQTQANSKTRKFSVDSVKKFIKQSTYIKQIRDELFDFQGYKGIVSAPGSNFN